MELVWLCSVSESNELCNGEESAMEKRVQWRRECNEEESAMEKGSKQNGAD